MLSLMKAMMQKTKDSDWAVKSSGICLLYLLAKELLPGLSYVSFAAKVFKKSRDEVYEYKKYIEMKVSKKGISPMVFVKKEKGK